MKERITIKNEMTIEREIDNKYDKYAIRVICKKNGSIYYLGYVPRYYSRELSEMLDKNVKYSAKIKYLNFESELNDEDITADVKLIFNSRAYT